MANRHLSRSIVLQSLFEQDFNTYGTVEFKEALRRNIEEFAPGAGDEEYIRSLSDGVSKKQKKIDDIITKAAPDWPIEKISIIDRNVLRIGLQELLFGDRDQVPPKVAINEAIELAKAFGGENSGKFVNGVLGTIYKEIGEPGKNDTSPHKETDPKKMPKEFLGGALVFRFDDKNIYLAFVHDVFGYWTLSKGHVEEGEEPKEGTIREIKEELGVDIEILATIGENEYTASDPEKGKIRKHVYYYLAKTNDKKLQLEKGGGLDDARWFALSEVGDLKTYGDMLPIITKGIEEIAKYQP
jgi:N utilization substance protein B